MQGAGKLLEIEGWADALDRPGVGVDVGLDGAPIRVAEVDTEGEVRFVRADDRLHNHLGLFAFDRGDHLVKAQHPGIFRRLACTDIRVGQPHDFLADHRQGAGHADDQHKKPDG